jgi:hypothetical protein
MKVLVRVVGTLLLVGLILTRVNLGQIMDSFATLRPTYWVAAFLLLFFTQVLSCQRWKVLATAVGFGGTFYEYLKALPNVRSKITKPTATAYQKDLAELSEKPIKTWLKEFTQMCVADRIEMVLRITQQGNPAQETIPDGEHIIEHKSSDLHALFNEFCKSNKLEYGVSVLKFGVMLKTLRYDNAISVKKTNTCNKTCINITILAEKL